MSKHCKECGKEQLEKNRKYDICWKCYTTKNREKGTSYHPQKASTKSQVPDSAENEKQKKEVTSNNLKQELRNEGIEIKLTNPFVTWLIGAIGS